MTVRVGAESAYPTLTPGPRVRIAEFAPFLRAHDIHLSFVSHIGDAEYRLLGAPGGHVTKARVVGRCAGRVMRRSRSRGPADLLMVHRLLSLVPVPGYDPPRCGVDVYDFDDALFETSTAVASGGFSAFKREGARCTAHLRRARLVLAGNEYLAIYARRYAKRVEIVPSCINPAAHTPRVHRDVEVLTVGWMGSPSTTPYLFEILPVLRAINADGVRMRLLAVGAAPLPRERWIEQQAWTSGSEAQLLSRFDVGIMPLPDDPWTRGKCGYKLLQYYAAGVPAVASPVGVNVALLERGGGIAAATSRDWQGALTEFARDATARRDSGGAGRRLAEHEYSYQRWAPELAAMLGSL